MQANLPLHHYFTKHGQRRALEAYADFAAESEWSVSHKMEMYDASELAFGDDADEATRYESFEYIYGNLNSNWQVFRPHGRSLCWPSRKIFDTLSGEFRNFSRAKGPKLRDYQSRIAREEFVRCLELLRGMKPNADYPIMAASKFLHFFNPGLFPIYDDAVVWQRVFRRFKSDYRSFCENAALDPAAGDAEFLANYTAWGSRLLSDAEDPMGVFVDWLPDELPRKKLATLDKAKLSQLESTAFEFTIIGAAVAEGY